MPIRKKKSSVNRLHARQARAAIRASTRKFIECCKTLAEARETLPHGDWIKFCADLGVSRRDASSMKEIGRHERLTDGSITGKLPWDPKVICELARLDPKPFDRLLAAGLIHKGMNRTQVQRLVRMTDAGRNIDWLIKPKSSQ